MKALHQDYQAVIKLPFGSVGISMHQGKLVGLDYLSGRSRSYRHPVAGLDRVLDAIEGYLDDALSGFDIAIELEGTAFQHRTWSELRTIPAGKTLTYGQLAQRLGSGARAVGNACRANPCPLVVPCHRVVAAKGLGGFAGARSGGKLEIKRWLLRHEGWL